VVARARDGRCVENRNPHECIALELATEDPSTVEAVLQPQHLLRDRPLVPAGDREVRGLEDQLSLDDPVDVVMNLAAINRPDQTDLVSKKCPDHSVKVIPESRGNVSEPMGSALAVSNAVSRLSRGLSAVRNRLVTATAHQHVGICSG